MNSEVTQSGPTLCDPMDCSHLGYSVHGIFQARVLDWVAISFSRGPSWPRDRTRVSRTVGRRFTVWATRERLMTSGFKNCLAILIILQFSQINKKTTHIYSIINFIITHLWFTDDMKYLFSTTKREKTKPNQRQYRKKKERKKEAI